MRTTAIPLSVGTVACQQRGANEGDLCLGVVEGLEQCDDFNDFGGDGCSAECQLEVREVASNSDAELRVLVQPLGCLVPLPLES